MALIDFNQETGRTVIHDVDTPVFKEAHDELLAAMKRIGFKEDDDANVAALAGAIERRLKSGVIVMAFNQLHRSEFYFRHSSGATACASMENPEQGIDMKDVVEFEFPQEDGTSVLQALSVDEVVRRHPHIGMAERLGGAIRHFVRKGAFE